MPVDALLANGTRFYFSTNGGSTYSELVDLKELGSPGEPEGPEVDVTPLAPTANYREFRIGLLKSGTITFKQFYNKARYTTLAALLRIQYDWKYVFPDNAVPASASNLTFKGYLKKLTVDPVSDPDDKILIMGEVTITGAITFTQGS